MPQVYATKEFTRDARRQGIGDDMLCKAADRAERGLIDADYRAGLVKQRVGRRGAFRVLAAFRAGHRCVFLYSFSKSERENIDDDELAHWRKIAGAFLQMRPEKLQELIEAGELREVMCDE